MKSEVNVAWPELVAYEQEATDLLLEQPDFEWDNWGLLIGGGLSPELEAELRGAGCAALLDITTDGMTVEGTTWTTPQQMLESIARFREILHSGSGLAAALLEAYEKVNYRERPGQSLELITEDLHLLAEQVEWAIEHGMTRVCMAVNV